MRIKTQFFITMLLFGLIMVVLAVSAVITSQQVEKAGEQERIAGGVARGASELSYLANDYLIYRESQQLKRWQSRFASFSEQVAGLEADKSEQQALVRNVRANQQRLKEVFDSVVSGIESPLSDRKPYSAPEFLQVAWSRMAVQTQALVSDASRLSLLLHMEIDQLRETTTRLIYVLVGLFGALLLAGYMLTYRRILRSIATLQAGTAIIGSGDLEFRIHVKRNDEIGDLSKAFNRMTADLKSVTASKADLEREVAERKRAEDELRRQREWLQVTLASIGDAVIATDTECRISFLNPVAAAMSGWPIEEALGRPVRELFRIIHEKSRETAEDVVSRVLREGRSVALANHTALIARDGREIPIEDSAAPIMDSAGKVAGVVVVFHDVTEKRRAAEALRESEAKYRTLFVNMAEEVHFWEIVRDDGGRIKTWRLVDANPPTLKSWGRISSEDIKGKTTDEIFGPGATEHYLPVVQKIMSEGVPYSFEDYFPNLDKHFRFTSVPLRDYFITTGADITGIKKAQEALQKAHAQLQDHARKLQETNRELEGFSYTISHDLRVPLRAINGFARMLADDYGPSLEGEGKRRLAVIEANAIKMGKLIDDLLAFSRAGRTALNTFGIDMNGLVAEVVEMLKTSEAGAKAGIHVAALPPAQGDPALIRQVLANLLENAAKFSRTRPEPRVEVGSFEQGGEQVYFVKDNGVGFDMKYSNKLFGVFQRLVAEKEFEGTGVGLAIVQRLVSRHGGRVWAEARPGKGASFFFTLGRNHDRA